MCVAHRRLLYSVSDLHAVSRSELVPWLQQQIAEQKRVDLATSGTPVLSDAQLPAVVKEPSTQQDLQLLLPVDTKKQRKHVKQLFTDRGEALFHSRRYRTHVHGSI